MLRTLQKSPEEEKSKNEHISQEYKASRSTKIQIGLKKC